MPWILTNIKPEVDLTASPPISRITLELLDGNNAGYRPSLDVLVRTHPGPGFLLALRDTSLNMPAEQIHIYDGLTGILKWRQVERAVEIELDTAFPARIHQKWVPGTPARLRVELKRSAVARALAGKKIGLDPGHGGKDAGARGAGYTEAEIVLIIGVFLYRWLTAHNARCVLTRKDDCEVPLSDRLSLMQKEQPDAIIELHTGKDTNPKRRGTIILFRRDPASHKLAQRLQQSIFRRNPFLVNGGICPSDEPLSCALPIPAVVILPEYITNHLGEGLLRATDFQQSIVQSLFDGLVAYFRSSP